MASSHSAHRIRHAARVLAAGGVVAHATEGVWGLSAAAFDLNAVWRVIGAKQRDAARGLIVISDRAGMLAPLVAPEADSAWKKAVASWPAALTWLLPTRATTPWWLTGGQSTIALRQTAHPLTAALCAQLDMPIISTSANVSGRPPAHSSWQVRARFGSHVDYILGGDCDTPGQPSVIRDAATGRTVRGR